MSVLTPTRVLVFSLAALLVLFAGPASAARVNADRGVSLTIGKFQVDQQLTKGREYTLAGFGVVNPGSEETTYKLGMMHVDGETLAPDSWFAFEKQEVTVAAGGTAPVAVKLVVPGNARPGAYRAYLRAEIAGSGEGTSVGAGAAAPVVFKVKSTSMVEEWRYSASDFLDQTGPWGYIVPGAALGALLLWLARRNLTFSVGRKA